MGYNFPNAPVLNQVFTSGDASWTWNGYAWIGNSFGISYTKDEADARFVNVSGDILAGQLMFPVGVLPPYLQDGFYDNGGSKLGHWITSGNLNWNAGGGAWRTFWDSTNCPWSPSFNGYQKLANGLILFWGRGSGSGADYWLAFPVAMTSYIFHLSAVPINTVVGQIIAVTVRGDYLLNQAVFQVRSTTGGTPAQHGSDFFYIGIGY